MNRTTRVALAAALALAGCPLPQPLPDYPPGTIAPPPRIVVDDSTSQISSPESVVRVAANCPSGQDPVYSLDARLRDADTFEPIDVRWFVNYDRSQQGSTIEHQQRVTTTDGTDPTLRDIDAFSFRPYEWDSLTGDPAAAGALRVVELVVSNGFHAPGGEDMPNRSPAPGFEVQVYRWVFLNVLPDDCAGKPSPCVPVVCPAPPP